MEVVFSFIAWGLVIVGLLIIISRKTDKDEG
jgi:hypothetical protein